MKIDMSIEQAVLLEEAVIRSLDKKLDRHYDLTHHGNCSCDELEAKVLYREIQDLKEFLIDLQSKIYGDCKKE